MKYTFFIFVRLLALLSLNTAISQPATTDHSDNPLVKEHVLGKLPSQDHLLIRNAYVLDYDPTHKAPRWVAYHLIEDYRKTPKRTGKWASYRADPDRPDEPKDSDYSGTFGDEIQNYAKGHLAPFMISGGDRNGDGKYLDADQDGKVEQGDDASEGKTVEEINYHTNLTPQHHHAFNGSGGVWYDIEVHIRELLAQKQELWVVAGPIFGPGTYDKIGPNEDVHVAPMFFQIIIWKEGSNKLEWEAYMMAHHQKAHGSLNEQMVSIQHIEAMTGLDFFKGLDVETEERESTYVEPTN